MSKKWKIKWKIFELGTAKDRIYGDATDNHLERHL